MHIRGSYSLRDVTACFARCYNSMRGSGQRCLRNRNPSISVLPSLLPPFACCSSFGLLPTRSYYRFVLFSLDPLRGTALCLFWFRRTEGVGGLYRGIGAVLVGGVPGMCIYLTTYEATKGFLADRAADRAGDGAPVSGGGGMLTHLTAGMLAEIVWWVAAWSV